MLISGLVALLAGAVGPAPPLPPVLAVHVDNGAFDPGDYQWARGAFPGADATEKANWQAIHDYSTGCRGTASLADRAAIAAAGYHPNPDYWRAYVGGVCQDVWTAVWTVNGFKSWADYQAALEAALPYYRTYMFAVSQAEQAAPIERGSLRDRLVAIVVPDQMLRLALSWGQGTASDAPPIAPAARTMLARMLWRPLHDIDHRNTAWLKKVVADHGWPTISKVGKRAAENAWLLVQHSDDDPAFQLEMLRLMKPLVAAEEVGKPAYALLYDRVMLPLTGAQRYGTQFICDGSGEHPRPIADPTEVDARRAAMGLSSLAAYREEIIRSYGTTCSFN